MPIISNFPGGSGSGGGGLALAGVSGIATLTAHEKVYIQWTDPDDLVVAGSTLAAWGGTLLVRKAGSMPTSRRDGVIVLDSKTRDAYKDAYFCDSGLTNGTTYYYKLFPYTTANAYTDVEGDGFSATPDAVPVGNVSSIALAPAGNGKLSIKWTDPAATVVTDGVTLATWASTIVVVKAGSYATSPTDTAAAFTYTSTTRNGHATNALIATGLTNGKTYYVSLFPMSADGKANTNTANRKSGVANRITISNIPAQSGTLTYDGNPKTPSFSNYDSTQLTLGGTTTGTNAVSYNATFTPKDDYMWDDGSITAKTVPWSIGKAPGSLTLGATAVTLNASNLTATVSVSRPGNGAVSATSSDTSVATVSVSNPTGSNPVVTISQVNQTTGTATVTISVAEGSNYTAPANQTVAVTAQFMPTKKALNDQTWAEIQQVSDAGKGSEYWNVGDRKGVLVKGTVGTLAVNQTLYVYILGFNHNSTREGNGIQFGTFKTALSGGTDLCLVDGNYNNYKTDGTKMFNMNHWGSVNYGGWKACDLRYDILGSTNKAPVNYGKARTTSDTGYDAPTNTATSPVANTLMAALPADLRAVMKPITKYTDNKGNSSDVAANVTSSLDYLPLLAEQEIFGGNRTYSNQYEKNSQVQYAYYSAGNSKVKYRHSATGSTADWWERSPCCDRYTTFCRVNTNGNASWDAAGYSRGLAPAFMV